MTDVFEREFGPLLRHRRVHLLRCEQQKLVQKWEDAWTEYVRDVERIAQLQREIERGEDALWWERFIAFCRTPCWRFEVR